jgi:hypothetical protein
MDEPTQNMFDPSNDQTQYLPVGPPPQPLPLWRRRGPVILAGVGVLAVAGLVVGIVLASPSGPPVPANAAAVAPASTTTTPAAGRRAAGHPKLGPGESLVVGTISSVSTSQLVVTPGKGGNPVTVAVDGTTKVAGGASAIPDLHAGERVQVIVRAGTAVTIRARQTAASATPTS